MPVQLLQFLYGVHSTFFRRTLVVLCCVFLAVVCTEVGLSTNRFDAAVSGEDQDTRGATLDSRPSGSFNSQAGKKWLLVVSTNYIKKPKNEDDSDQQKVSTLPELKNAENDGIQVIKTLSEFYGYRAVKVGATGGADDKKGSGLIGEAASADNIKKGLEWLVSGEVKEEDSVVVFFSGHGLKDRSEEFGSGTYFLPNDYELKSNGDGNFKPGKNCLKLHTDIVEKLKACSARQILLVLDHCYSGDVFNQSFQPRSKSSQPSDSGQRTFEVMASCRAYELAADGKYDKSHSPFTEAFLDGLRRIPAYKSDNGKQISINTSSLFSHIESWFSSRSQKPDHRNLINQNGSFVLRLRGGDVITKLRREYKLNDGDRNVMSALVSTGGGWWFEERPWFIPGIRHEIFLQMEQERTRLRDGTKEQKLTEFDERNLKRVADRFCQEKLADTGSKETNLEEHKRHYRQLRESHNTPRFEAVVDNIRNELFKRYRSDKGNKTENGTQLCAESLHLLAVLQHASAKRDESWRAQTREIYELAIEKFSPSSSEKNKVVKFQAVFCRADFAKFLRDVGEESWIRDAIQEYEKIQEALPLLSIAMAESTEDGEQSKQESGNLRDTGRLLDSAAVFRIHTGCLHGKAYLAINDWKTAEVKLNSALATAQFSQNGTYHEAYVYAELAWMHMMQAKLTKAKECFEESNKIIGHLISNENRTEIDVQAAAKDIGRFNQNQSENCDREQASVILDGREHTLKVKYLHNLHGLAMVTRFQGNTACAIHSYRDLIIQIEQATDDLIYEYPEDFSVSLCQRFHSRLINSLERLADCSLFGDVHPTEAREAFDNYRRAINWTHRLLAGKRDRVRATLLYKSALALIVSGNAALPPDVDLAKAMTAHADRLCKHHFGSSDDNSDHEEAKMPQGHGLLWALHSVTGPLVRATEEALPQQIMTPKSQTGELSCRERLRQRLDACLDAIGQMPHRDELEVLLFSNRILLDRWPAEHRYEQLRDADRLLECCRLALGRFERRSGQPEQKVETIKWLRPYYDSIMRARLSVWRNVRTSENILGLIELQHEATKGVRYVKPNRDKPIVALYNLDEECLVMVHIPGRNSTPVKLRRILLEELKSGEIPLPDELRSKMLSHRASLDSEAFAYLRWNDPQLTELLTLGIHKRTDKGAQTTMRPTYNSGCPFAVPDGFIIEHDGKEYKLIRKQQRGPQE